MKICPSCHKEFDPDGSVVKPPFCSERCRLIDLGAWLTEKHKIPGTEVATEFNEADDGNEPTRH